MKFEISNYEYIKIWNYISYEIQIPKNSNYMKLISHENPFVWIVNALRT